MTTNEQVIVALEIQFENLTRRIDEEVIGRIDREVIPRLDATNGRVDANDKRLDVLERWVDVQSSWGKWRDRILSAVGGALFTLILSIVLN